MSDKIPVNVTERDFGLESFRSNQNVGNLFPQMDKNETFFSYKTYKNLRVENLE